MAFCFWPIDADEVSLPTMLNILIVNYRSTECLIGCLKRLRDCIDEISQIIVVDNDSRDGSLEQILSIRRELSLQERLFPISSSKNGGFSFGNNIGIRASLANEPPPDYLLLLNPDTVVEDGAVSNLVAFMDRNPRVGIAGSRLENSDGVQEASAHTFPSPLGELESGTRLGSLSRVLARHVVTPPQPLNAAPCDWVSGASMIIRTKVIQEIGLMDEGFFLYFEEVDFCKRAKAAGWECWYVPESRVMHLEGASTGIKEKNKRRPRYWYDSRCRYFVKHHGIFGLILADCLWATGRVTYLLRRALKLGAQGESRDPRLFMFDLLWGDLRSILSGNVFRIERFGK